MAAYTCWQDVLDDITNRMRKTKSLLRFSKLKTNEDRVDFCLKDDITKTKVQQWVNIMCSSRHKKFWEKASELRAEGNMCFQEREYKKAVEFYTQSILAAPFPDSDDVGSHADELSLGYGNRSAALFHLHLYEACLEDLKRALEFKYPSDLSFKLYQRKGQCLMKLGYFSLAKQAFDEALEFLQDARLDSRRIERQRKEIENLKQLAAQEEGSGDNRDTLTTAEPELPQLAQGLHPTLACASSAVEMKFTKDKGRHILVNTSLPAGSTLFIEKPYASVLLPGHYSSHCHHCFKKPSAPLPCHQCSQVRFCSEECIKESWEKYHKWECGNLDLLHSVGIAHLSCRVILVTGLSHLKEFQEKISKPSDPLLPPGVLDGGYYGNCYYSVYYLMTHVDDMHVEDTFQYALTALLLLMLLDRMPFFGIECNSLRDRLSNMNLVPARVGSAPSTPTHKSRSPIHSRHSMGSVDDVDLANGPPTFEMFVGGLLLRHILQLVCNAHAVTELQVAPQTGQCGSVFSQRQVRVATGIYPTASLMNHSCKPTIISSFIKNNLIVRTIKDVEENEEIFNCYGPHYRRMTRDDRQRALLEQYFFLCNCEGCEEEDDREQRFQALKCSLCSGPLRAPDSANRTACMDCKKSQDCAAQLQKVFTAHDLFVQGLQLAAKGSYKDALERLRRCHKLRERVMYCHNRQLAEVQDQIACCYASLGKMTHAIEYLRPTLSITEAVYGPNSVELANELQKFSDLLMNAVPQLTKEGMSRSRDIGGLIQEANKVTDRACKIFAIHYGPHHEAIKELQEKKGYLKDLGEC